ncbi:hypothetical protein P692DRAFT_201872904 [Suillus brevipes Sb2]|nr:hypothetical protein P692DRAFT_201872904 [Suillus brevipes Sb2]
MVRPPNSYSLHPSHLAPLSHISSNTSGTKFILPSFVLALSSPLPYLQWPSHYITLRDDIYRNSTDEAEPLYHLRDDIYRNSTDDLKSYSSPHNSRFYSCLPNILNNHFRHLDLGI